MFWKHGLLLCSVGDCPFTIHAICQTLALCKNRKTPWKPQPPLSQLGEARIKGKSTPIGQRQGTEQKCGKVPSQGESHTCENKNTPYFCPDCLSPSQLGMNPMSCREDTSRNFAHKSFNTELRNINPIFLQFFPFHYHFSHRQARKKAGTPNSPWNAIHFSKWWANPFSLRACGMSF